ncbi:hypothetical protein [uncultured Nonlabens sp.]|uniref:hypothetical protein n=1 Tax=uncultured Nonlabens sp. TaxID=859306 RepID=UPI0026038C67|nr:hypothetical protein [uncultured Nonlabens sp.]
MRLSILFFWLIIACKPEPADVPTSEDQIDYSTMNLSVTKMALVGKAQKEALKWVDYQNLITGLENYDHSITTTNELIEHLDKMIALKDGAFYDQTILSRILVLKTRLSIYKSYLGYRIKTTEDLQRKYNDIITALDQLTDQMNWFKNEFESNNKETLEDLKAILDPDQV